MTPRTKWRDLLEIANADRDAFLLLLSSPLPLALSCFHAQQSAEKYMKSFLLYHGIDYPYTHDLVALFNILVKHGFTPSFSREQIEKLNPFAVQIRYDLPAEIPVTREEIKEIVDFVANWCKKQCHD